jgi:hypothetical protein
VFSNVLDEYLCLYVPSQAQCIPFQLFRGTQNCYRVGSAKVSMRGDCEPCGLLLFADIFESLAGVLNLSDGFLKC